MDTSTWFDDLPVLGNMPPEEAAVKLREMGEEETAATLEMAKEAQPRTFAPWEPIRWPFRDKPWQHTAHTFGYLAPVLPGSDLLPIRHVENIPADLGLQGASIKITLNRLRVAGYPGSGMHRVLLHFFVQNQVPGKTEHVHFNATYRVHEGEHAGIQGYHTWPEDGGPSPLSMKPTCFDALCRIMRLLRRFAASGDQSSDKSEPAQEPIK